MTELSDPLVALAAVSALVGGAGSAVVWRQRSASGARAYTVLLLALTAWSALYAGQLLAPTVEAKRSWLVARHVISPVIPVAFWVFTARYTDHPRLLTVRYFGPIVICGLLLAPTPILNPGDLYWTDLALTRTASTPVLDLELGPLFWMMIGYIAFVVACAHALVVQLSMDSFDVYRRQLVALAIVGIVEFSLLGLFLSDHVHSVPSLNPVPHVQVVAYSAVFMAIPLGWSYYRDALFDAQPLANQTVIGNMNDAVFVLDPDGVIRKTNEPGRRLTGADSEAELRGSSVVDALADRPALAERFAAASDDEGTTSSSDVGSTFDAVAVTIRGEQRFCDLRSSEIRDSSGRQVGTVIVVRDVTERKRRERELETFTGVVSHDLRQPMRTTEQYLELLEDEHGEELDETGNELLAVARRNSRRMQAMIADLREYSRIERAEEPFVPIDCEPLVGDVVETNRYEIDDRDATVIVEDLPVVQGSEHLLQRLFQNLLANALQHAGEAPNVRFSALRNGAKWRFAVTDDGPGIDPELSEDVFELFTRGSSATADGTGMGLTIAERIVQKHGGSIGIEPAPGGGTRVWFTLPATDEE